jgi:Flp pilus assembly CpaE family ATPase
MDKTCILVTQEPIPVQVLLNLFPLFRELSHSKDIELVLNRYQKDNRTITSEMIESLFGQTISLKIPDVRYEALASELERQPLNYANGGELVSALKELAQKIVIDLAIPKEGV